jgi:transcriptional regulator with XRE-family HTH domain
MAELFSDQLRQAIERSGLSRYAIGKATGIDKGTMSRFMAGHVGLSLESIEKIVDVLDLRLEARKKPRQPKPGTDRP